MTAPDPTPRPAAAASAVRDWTGYFDAIADAGPRETLVDAADRFDADRDRPFDLADLPFAIDFGCGTGRDTLELLKRGWRVLALDGEPEALERLRARPDFAPYRDDPRLETRVATFDNAVFPTCNLFNASFTLPFCPPDRFDDLWARVIAAIAPRGRFAGQFFGEQDDWATIPDRTHHTREQVDSLLGALEIETLDVDLYGPDPTAAYPKRWHIYHVVARRNA